MAGICFCIDPEDCNEIDLDGWQGAARFAGDIDTLAIIGRGSEVSPTLDDTMGLCVYANMNQFLDDHQDRSMVHVDTSVGRNKGSVPLWQYHHEIDWYLFGRNGGADPEVASVISIPQPNQAKLPVTLIASTVLLHRSWVRCGGAD